MPGTAGSPGGRAPSGIDGASLAVTSTFWLTCEEKFTEASADRSMYCEIGGIGTGPLGAGAPALAGSPLRELSRAAVEPAAAAFIRTNCPGGQAAAGGFCVLDDVSSLVDLTQPVIVNVWFIGDGCVDGVCAATATIATTMAPPVANN